MDSTTRRVALGHLDALCSFLPDRRPGSRGNHNATGYVTTVLERALWSVHTQEFECLDWETSGGSITVGDVKVELTPSPYGLGTVARGPLRVLTTLEDLARTDLAGSIAMLAGDLAAEPLTPKAYPFYGSEDHAAVITSLEQS